MNAVTQREEEYIKRAQKFLLTVMKSNKGYMIVDYYTERIIAGHEYSLTLDDVEKFLNEIER